MEDPYLSDVACCARLLEEYEKHGIIVACDFDSTIHDWHKIGFTYPKIIHLLQKCNKYNIKIVINTCNTNEQYVQDYCLANGIYIAGINVNLLDMFKDCKKVYANILLDDRAGLASAYLYLSYLIDTLERKHD